MKKVIVAVFALLLLATPVMAKELRLYVWANYMPDDFIPNFEKQTGIDVRVDHFTSMEEMMAKLQVGGESQYDVVMPSDYIVTSMVKMGLLRELDHSKIPNMKNLDDMFRDPVYDRGNAYTVPYQWGTLGIIYNKDVVKDKEISWGLLFDPEKQAGPFVLLDSFREMLGCAEVYLGMDVNTTDKPELQKLAKLMLDTKKSDNFAGFEVGLSGRNKVVGNSAIAAIVYNGSALRALKNNPNLAFAVPVEGTIAWVDNLVITKHAPNPDAAYAFINYVLDAKTGAHLSNWTRYATPNKASLPYIDPALLKDDAVYLPQSYLPKLHFLKDLGKKSRIYDELWTMVKAR